MLLFVEFTCDWRSTCSFLHPLSPGRLQNSYKNLHAGTIMLNWTTADHLSKNPMILCKHASSIHSCMHHVYNYQFDPSCWPIDLCDLTNQFEPRDFAPGVCPPGWKCSPSSDKDDCPCSPWRLLSSPWMKRLKTHKDVHDDSIQKNGQAEDCKK